MRLYLSEDNGFAIEWPHKNSNVSSTGSDLFLLDYKTLDINCNSAKIS